MSNNNKSGKELRIAANQSRKEVKQMMKKKSSTGSSSSDNSDTSCNDETGWNDLTPEEREYRNAVVPPLLMHSYHLPGNNYYEDWYQYMFNNHPVFGIFCHHKYHPVKRNVRIMSLIGSVLFGLAITNVIYLAFVFYEKDYDKSYIELHTNTTITGKDQIDSNVNTLSVTNGNIALWTIGSALNALFDNLIWSMAACTCCMNDKTKEEKLQRYRNTGAFFIVLSVIVVTALVTFSIALRAALNSNDGTEQIVTTTDSDNIYQHPTNSIQLWQVDGANDYEFIIAYFVEVALNFFVWYPVVGTVLFTGILTCGHYPVIGGRPYEINELQKEKEDNDEELGMEVVLDDDDNTTNIKDTKIKVTDASPKEQAKKTKK